MSASSPGTGSLDLEKRVEELEGDAFHLTQTTQPFAITTGRNLLTPSKPTNDAILVGVILSTSANIYLKGFTSDGNLVSVHNISETEYAQIDIVFSWLVKARRISKNE